MQPPVWQSTNDKEFADRVAEIFIELNKRHRERKACQIKKETLKKVNIYKETNEISGETGAAKSAPFFCASLDEINIFSEKAE